MDIFLSHNPFLIETSITIDGKKLDSDHQLSEILSERLQKWSDNIFNLIEEYLNYPDHINLNFKGLKSDFDEIEQAAEVYKSKKNVEVELKFESIDDADERLRKIDALIDDVKKGKLNGALTRDELEELIINFGKAIDPKFNINVIATVSSGKSTVINSMLGTDLLPALNRATTATIVRFHDTPEQMGFVGKSFNKSGEQVYGCQAVTAETIKNWNDEGNEIEGLDRKTSEIHLYGKIPYIKKHPYLQVVFVDTPGPNNSQNEEHGKKTIEAIREDEDQSMILYVLNATQLAITDDKLLLESVKEKIFETGNAKQSKDRVVFLINKIDDIDSDKESIESIVNQVKKYLETGKYPISNPVIIPVSAKCTFIKRKLDNKEPLTDHEKDQMDNYLKRFNRPANHLLNYMMGISPSVKWQVNSMIEEAEKTKDKYRLASIHSGIPVLECVINEYLEKYALLRKINTMYSNMQKIIDSVSARIASDKSMLELTASDRDIVKKKMDEILLMIEDGEKFKYLRDKKMEREILFPKEIEDKLSEVRKNGFEVLQVLGNEFVGEVDPESAKKFLEKATNEYGGFRVKTLVLLEEARALMLNNVKGELLQLYREYIAELFGSDKTAFTLPAIEKLKVTALNLPCIDNIIDKQTRVEKVKVGTREIDNSTWYKPWTWWDKKTEPLYKNMEITNLMEIWSERRTDLTRDFEGLIEAIKKDMKDKAKDLERGFFISAESQLEPLIKNLLNESNELSKNQSEKEERIEKINQKINSLELFKKKASLILEF